MNEKLIKILHENKINPKNEMILSFVINNLADFVLSMFQEVHIDGLMDRQTEIKQKKTHSFFKILI